MVRIDNKTTFYYRGLKDRLPSDNNGNEVVLNKDFKDWQHHIYTNLHYRSQKSCGKYYTKGDAKELLRACVSHRYANRNYANIDSCDTVIMLTHPLFLHLSEMRELHTDRLRVEAETYLDKFLYLTSIDRKNKFSLVLSDTVHHYAAATSLLLEKGKVDDVIFTQYGNGHILFKDELHIFKDKTVNFGGLYNGMCLATSIDEMRRTVHLLPTWSPILSRDKIWAIRDLILNQPNPPKEAIGSVTIVPNSIIGLPSNKIVYLDDVLKTFGLNSDLGKN